MRKEVVGLEHHPEPAPDVDRVDRGVGDHLAVEEDVSVVDLLQQVDAAQDRRLSRPRGADQRDGLMLGDSEVDPMQNLTLPEGLGHAGQLQDGLAHRRVPPPLPAVQQARHRDRDAQVEQGGGHERRVVEGRGGDDLRLAKRLARDADDRDQGDVLLEGDEVVEQRRADVADCLRDDHVAQGLGLGQADRQRRVALAPVHRVDPRAVDLGDVGAVGERQREPAQDHRLGRQPAQRRLAVLRGDRERRHAKADQVDEEDRGDPSEDVREDGRQEPQREHRRRAGQAKQRHRQTEDQDTDLDDQEDPDVQPERLEDVRERVGEVLRVEERVADQRPAGTGHDQYRHPPEDDDGRDRRDRQAPAVPAALGRLALGAAVAHAAGGRRGGAPATR